MTKFRYFLNLTKSQVTVNCSANRGLAVPWKFFRPWIAQRIAVWLSHEHFLDRELLSESRFGCPMKIF